MECRLTIQERLKDLRKEKKVTIDEVAKGTGLSKSAIGYYEDTAIEKEISHSAIIALAKYYHVSTDYLLGMTENRSPVSTDISDLHLDDKTAARLKSGSFNNRLWNEMTKHPAFPLLLADIEIYVDGIASMQIQTLNSTVDYTRKQIKEKFQLSDDDYYMHTMETAHIDEFKYFSTQIHDDLDRIIQDLRKSHSKDKYSAPENSVLSMIEDGIKTAESTNGTYDQKMVAGWCAVLGINRHGIAPGDLETFARILNKSKVFRTAIKRQGKAPKRKKE